MRPSTLFKCFLFSIISVTAISIAYSEEPPTLEPPTPPTPIVTKPEIPTIKLPTTLTVDRSLYDIYQYQDFFEEKRNMPQIQVPSPSTQYMWQNMSRVFRTEMLLRDGEVSPLRTKMMSSIGTVTFKQKEFGQLTVNEFFDQYPLDAMIVIHHGKVVFEKYKTMRSFDMHNWSSMGKIISSTMIALLEKEGKIDVTKPVTQYLPMLKGTAWDSVPVIDVLNMATGLDSTEHEEPNDDARTNPARGWYQWAVSLGIYPDAIQQHESPVEVLKRMKRVKPGNTAFEYNSINTWILELIVERLTGKPLNEAFGDYVWRKIGPQNDGYIGITPGGYPMAWGSVSSTLRDLGRFGMIFTPSWSRISQTRIITPDILKKIQHGGNPDIYGKGYVGRDMLATLEETQLSNSYQWDTVFPDGDFYKNGNGGQGLYISPSRDLVIAWFATGDNAEQVMARAIATSSLF